MAELAVDRLCVNLGGRRVVRDASWRLRAGELVALLGANGAGKTTVLRGVLGLTPRAAGEVRVGEDDPIRMSPSARARCIAYLPQVRPLAWPVRVCDVVALGRFAYGATPERLGAADEEARRACRPGVRSGAVRRAFLHDAVRRGAGGACTWRGRWPPMRPSCWRTSRPRPSIHCTSTR